MILLEILYKEKLNETERKRLSELMRIMKPASFLLNVYENQEKAKKREADELILD